VSSGAALLAKRSLRLVCEKQTDACALFDVDVDLYGRHLRVAFVDFIRPEQKFAGLDALKAQIAVDAARAREILAATPPIG